jgi:hypothetical protein
MNSGAVCNIQIAFDTDLGIGLPPIMRVAECDGTRYLARPAAGENVNWKILAAAPGLNES